MMKKEGRESEIIMPQLVKTDKNGAFVVQHETIAVAKCSQRCNEEFMWNVDYGASNHMTEHKNWFQILREPEIPSYV